MSIEIMKRGDVPISPFTITQGGLTYREWLIGMALSNPKIVDFLDSTTYENNIEINTKAVVDTIDAIIKQLDKEAEK